MYYLLYNMWIIVEEIMYYIEYKYICLLYLLVSVRKHLLFKNNITWKPAHPQSLSIFPFDYLSIIVPQIKKHIQFTLNELTHHPHTVRVRQCVISFRKHPPGKLGDNHSIEMSQNHKLRKQTFRK